MTDRAPERIWLEQFSAPFEQKYWSQAHHPESATEYIRADLVPSPPALSGEASEVVNDLLWATDVFDAHKDGSVYKKYARITRQAASLIERQAGEIAEMVGLLSEAVECIRIFHGPIAWEIYRDKSPEMQRFRAALASRNPADVP